MRKFSPVLPHDRSYYRINIISFCILLRKHSNYFRIMHYICPSNKAGSSANVSNGALAHLARARHWQCRGDEFESHTLHKLSNYYKILEFRAFKDFLFYFFSHSFILIQRGRILPVPAFNIVFSLIDFWRGAAARLCLLTPYVSNLCTYKAWRCCPLVQVSQLGPCFGIGWDTGAKKS